MADPLGIPASITAVIQLAGDVMQYINDTKDDSGERLRIRDEISSTSFLLYMLKDRIQQAHLGEPWLSTAQLIDVTNGPLQQFKRALEQLALRLALSKGLKKIGKALTWTFQKGEVKEILSTIERQASLFDLAMQNDHM